MSGRIGVAFLAVGWLAGCGLGQGGLGGAPDASLSDGSSGEIDGAPGTGSDATSGSDGSGSGTGPADAHGAADSPTSPLDGGATDSSIPPPPADAGCTKNPDCTSSPAGSKCVQGVCGCNGPGDCPAGEACSANHLCSQACTGGLTCNGGCCDGTACLPGTADDTCGDKGTSCTSCGGQTPTCSGGTCSSSCGQPTDGTCGTGFCCSNGSCGALGQTTTCGASGQTCVDCTNAAAGQACNNGKCGCNAPGDCSKSSNGHACLGNLGAGGSCGCMVSTDCPMGLACNSGSCTAACGGVVTCNGGCCNAGTCVMQCPMNGAGMGMCNFGSCN